jgi:hypothetical protein
MEVSWVFFDVCLEWDEVLVDEGRGLIVAVRLGFQPSTCASGRSRAEIDEQRFLTVFGFRECRVSVCHPIDFHSCPPVFATKKHKQCIRALVPFVAFSLSNLDATARAQAHQARG